MSEPADILEFSVGVNQPKTAARPNGTSPGAPVQGPAPAPGVVVDPTAGRYWTPERAERAVAYACKALATVAGDDMKASAFELDMIGAPLAALLHDLWPLPSSEGAGRTTNALIVAGVLGFMVLVRLPAIMVALEQHRARKGEQPPEGQAAAVVDAPPAQAATSRRQGGWEPPRPVGDGTLGR